MGRKKKKDEERKVHQINIRITDKQMEALNRLSFRYGQPKTEWLRCGLNYILSRFDNENI